MILSVIVVQVTFAGDVGIVGSRMLHTAPVIRVIGSTPKKTKGVYPMGIHLLWCR